MLSLRTKNKRSLFFIFIGFANSRNIELGYFVFSFSLAERSMFGRLINKKYPFYVYFSLENISARVSYMPSVCAVFFLYNQA